MPKQTPREPKDLTYSEASAELDEIVAYFEEVDVDVDELVVKLERATALVDELDTRLKATKLQVDELAPRLADVADEVMIDPETGEVLDD